MAKRLNLTHDDETRRKIQTTQLIKRLGENALSDKEIMTPGQIKSAEVLLKKCLPDLASVEISGDDDKPLTVKVTWEQL